MNKTIVMVTCMVMLCLGLGAQTLGEKYQLPEEPGELRADGVYHLPTSLLENSKQEAYFRFFPDGTFIVYHAQVSPENKPEVFQINCNYQRIASAPAPFNQDYTLKRNGYISRSKIRYPDKAILLEFDVRKDVIAATIRTLDLEGKMTGKAVEYVMPFYQITWPVSSGD